MSFDQIPPNWIGVISALAGGLLVGTFALVSKYIDKISEGRAISRNKLEELHLLVNEYLEAISMVHAEAYEKDPESIGPRALADHFRQILFKPQSRMNTLVNLYAPEASDEFSALSDQAVEFVLAATNFVVDQNAANDVIDKCHSDMLVTTMLIQSKIENLMFRSNLIPNQSFSNRFRAKWKYVTQGLGAAKHRED